MSYWAPLLVWYFFIEQPGATVLIGGAIVFTAVVWYLWVERGHPHILESQVT